MSGLTPTTPTASLAFRCVIVALTFTAILVPYIIDVASRSLERRYKADVRAAAKWKPSKGGPMPTSPPTSRLRLLLPSRAHEKSSRGRKASKSKSSKKRSGSQSSRSKSSKKKKRTTTPKSRGRPKKA